MDKTCVDLTHELHECNMNFINLMNEVKMLYEVALKLPLPDRIKMLNEALLILKRATVEMKKAIFIQKEISDAQSKEVQIFSEVLQGMESAKFN